jgi:hypothetical protein
MMHLLKEERKILCNYLTDKLLSVFQAGEYTSEQDLQEDFQMFKLNLKQYHAVLDRLLKDNLLNRELTWRDIKITAKRWHICKMFGKPFIAYDRFNKMKICANKDYVRYKTSTGAYFKSTGKSKYMLHAI